MSASGLVAAGPDLVASLEACERVIEAGLDTFVEVGTALLTIRDGRLYRAAFPTFESYCQERWGFGRGRSRHMIEAAQVATSLCTAGTQTLPANERQARALVPLKDDPAALAEAWDDANEIAESRGVRVSHTIVEQAVARKIGPSNDSGRAWARKGERVAATVIANLVAVSQSIASLDVGTYRASQEEIEGLDRTIKALRTLRNSLVSEK